eukprot:10775751-Lingulodinium_polyedra.AAC.1
MRARAVVGQVCELAGHPLVSAQSFAASASFAAPGRPCSSDVAESLACQGLVQVAEFARLPPDGDRKWI